MGGKVRKMKVEGWRVGVREARRWGRDVEPGEVGGGIFGGEVGGGLGGCDGEGVLGMIELHEMR